MAITIDEVLKSRPFTYGAQNDWELIYLIQGVPLANDDSTVIALLGSTSPGTYQGLLRETIHAEPEGNGIWMGYVKYMRLEDNTEYTFETGGGTQHITQSLQTTIYDFALPYTDPYGDPYGDDTEGDVVYTAPDFNGAIGVNGESVEGVDITVPIYEFSETHLLPDLTVTLAYKLALFQATGKINNATFKGFDIGEVLFLGASGNKRGDTQWAITYRFACSPNQTNFFVGGINVTQKYGQDYMWIRYEDFEDDLAQAIVKRPTGVYIEKVYYDADFSTIGIGT